MKRNMDLIRDLMLKLEALSLPPGHSAQIPPDAPEMQVEGYDTTQIDYHLALIEKAGFIDSGGIEPMVGIGFRSLSWTGHDFLDSVRSPDVWDKTKKVAAAAGGFTVDLLVATAKTYLEAKFKGLIGG